MISFSDRVIMSSLTNLVAEKEELGAASPGPWDRLAGELDRLLTRQSNIEVLSIRIDEFFSMSPEQVAAAGVTESDYTDSVRDEYGDLETTASGEYNSGY
jgi:hypothetical protein